MVVFIAFVSITPVDANEERDKIKNYCRGEWGTDYRMIEHCYNSQMDAAKSNYVNYFDPYVNTLPTPLTSMDQLTPEAEIVITCMSEWKLPEYDTYDFRMVKHCCETQFKAYERMK